MVGDTNKILTDYVYERGVPVTFSRGTGYTVEGLWKQIDWNRPDMENAQRMDAAAQILTRLHYGKLSQLMLCSRLRGLDCSEAEQEIVTRLTAHNIEELETWGRYLQQCGCSTSILDEQRELYGALFKEDDPLTLLLTLSLFDVIGRRMYAELGATGKGLFEQVMRTVAEAGETTDPVITQQLGDLISDRSIDEQNKVQRQVIHYVELAENTVDERVETIKLFDVDVHQLVETAKHDLEQFSTQIGLPINMFRQ